MGLQDNKSPWATGKSIDTDRTPALSEIVNRQFAAQYLAQRLQLAYGDMRQLRDRIGKKLDTAVGNGKLKSVNGEYNFGDLAKWARSRKDLAPAVEALTIPATVSVNITMPMPTLRAFGFSLPTSLSECQAALADAYRDLHAMREEMHTLKATVAALAPLQVKAMARSEAAKRAGKQGGRGVKK